MTKLGTGEERGAEDRRCAWCGRRLPQAASTGRPRRYCKPGCRQQAYTARRWAGIDWLLENADPLADAWLEPRALEP